MWRVTRSVVAQTGVWRTWYAWLRTGADWKDRTHMVWQLIAAGRGIGRQRAVRPPDDAVAELRAASAMSSNLPASWVQRGNNPA